MYIYIFIFNIYKHTYTQAHIQATQQKIFKRQHRNKIVFILKRDAVYLKN